MIVSLSQWLLFSRQVNTSFSDGMDVGCLVPFRFIPRLLRQLTRIPSPGDVFGLTSTPLSDDPLLEVCRFPSTCEALTYCFGHCPGLCDKKSSSGVTTFNVRVNCQHYSLVPFNDGPFEDRQNYLCCGMR